MKIKTEHVFPPIPTRNHDWAAIDDDTYDGVGSLVGWGATKEAAVEDLLEQMLECQIEEVGAVVKRVLP